jgi:hypothetical protein
VANATHCGELGLNVVEAQVDLATIGLKLGFARASGSDAATKLRHGAAAADEARQLIFELREFYLKLTLTGLGVSSEDVEDELRTVDHVARQPGFDVTELRRGKVVVEENKRRVGVGHNTYNFVELALTDEARRIGFLTALNEGGGNGRTGGPGKFLKLCAARIEVEGRDSIIREVFLSSDDGSCSTGESSGGGDLLALAKFSGELDYNKYGELLLRLRGTQFPGEKRRVLSLTCFDETTADCLTAIPA